MPRYAVLLRGVNVGGSNLVPMADLRALLGSLGATEARTLLNSGNAACAHPGRSAAALAKAVRAALVERLGVDVPVIVKSAADLEAAIAENPLAKAATNPSRLLFAFAAEPAALAGLEAIRPLVREPDRFAIGKHAAYLWCANGISASKAAAALLGRAGREVTTRNAATVGKLLAMLRAGAA